MSSHNIFNDGSIHVCESMCKTCIFRPGNLMRLEDGRVKDMVDHTNKEDGRTIVCHKTLYTDQNAVCRGWLDSQVGQRDAIMKLAHVMDRVKEIDPDAKETS